MSRGQTALLPEFARYIQDVSLREPELLVRLREETSRLPEGSIQVSPEQGQFMGMLVRMLAAVKTLEIGVFTGYSSLSVALALPAGGVVLACDVSEQYTAIARRYWREAGVESKIDLRLAPALQTLDGLTAAGAAGSFDFAFIDADKENYLSYYERVLELLRPGGVAAIDNVLWHGKVLSPAGGDEETHAIVELNRLLRGDSRVWLSMLPIGDGLTLAMKR